VNLFNRIVITLLLLALAGGAIAIVALAWTLPEDSISGLRDGVNWLDDNNGDLEKVILTTAGALIALVAFAIIVMELIPSAGKDVKVSDVEAGNVVLSTAAIAERVDEAVREVPNVAQVKSVVRGRRKGVEVFLDLHVDPNANLAAVSAAACDAARRVLSERVHVPITGQPRVRLHYRELRLQQAAARPEPVEASRSEPEGPRPEPVEGPRPEAVAGPAGEAVDPAEPALAAPGTTERQPPPEGVVRQDGA
jgi:hypothetical protein